MSFFNELKRRNVFRVAIAYLAGAWLLIEVSDTIFPYFGLGDSSVRILIILLAIAFPMFLIFSWVFEITPEGLMLERDVEREKSITAKTGKALDRVIIVLLVSAVSYFAFDKFVQEPIRDAAVIKETAEQARADAIVESYGDKSIAVLPFVNMSADPEQEYFADGVSEELLNLLAKIPELRVIARTSSFSYKNKDVKAVDLARELNVGHVLEGSVRKSGNRVRITAQLIEARSDTHLWSETFERTLDDIFSIQDEIANSVVTELEPLLLEQLEPVQEINPEAYALQLMGYHYLRQRGKDNLEKSVEAFRQALDLEPEYALAWVGLGVAINSQVSFHLRDIEEGTRTSRAAVEKALKIDDSLLEAHLALANIQWLRDWDWAGAVESIETAASINSEDQRVTRFMADLSDTFGFQKTGIQLRKSLLETDPLNALGHAYLALSLIVAGRYEEAESEIRLTYELDPGLWYHERDVGRLYLLQGKFEQALQTFDKEPDSFFRHHGRAMTFCSLGQKQLAEPEIEVLIREFSSSHAFQIASANAWCGEVDQSFDWLERAREQRDVYIPFVHRAPFLENLKSDTRWEEFLGTIGLSLEERTELFQQLTESPNIQ